MWKLKVAEGGPWLKSGNNHIGRETWEFDPNFGSNEEREAVDSARQEFQKNRFRTRHSSDILARMQVLGVFEWSGLNPIPPEFFLLPSLVPIQPDAFKRHLARVADFLWVGEDGMKVRVCAGQLWDVAFAVRAILACNIADEYGSTLKKAHDFIKASQIMDNPSGNFSRKFRHVSKGGWAFQVADQGWQVSDCTAEALKVR
ncbi:hypothetical protein PR202_gb25592 [Eleusine coracana subsp. coracana]|uniref:Squalene cyclase C-terminal domain-containing protein n=1 Tax=Eleusine coracana subsp. coracana TaxID=191504 RepID=A0AAV5FQJ8_ELECO|nr:hypothetical protein PR202_gb25592 [Eleusine coracana subsp. coracana]